MSVVLERGVAELRQNLITSYRTAWRSRAMPWLSESAFLATADIGVFNRLHPEAAIRREDCATKR